MHTIIFANGDPPDRATAQPWIEQADLIVAADGGSCHALAIDVTPHIVIGDLDSLDPDTRSTLERTGVQFVVYPAHKDCTDLELAIGCALERGATDITLLGALGRRWDQSLANILLLTLPQLERIAARIIARNLSISVIRERAVIAGRVGDTLSLLALRGDTHGVTLDGCEYPLVNAVLPFGASLGISNVFVEPVVSIRVTAGCVLALHAAQEKGDEA
jgi:thiamine pyrophosphokinase